MLRRGAAPPRSAPALPGSARLGPAWYRCCCAAASLPTASRMAQSPSLASPRLAASPLLWPAQPSPAEHRGRGGSSKWRPNRARLLPTPAGGRCPIRACIQPRFHLQRRAPLAAALRTRLAAEPSQPRRPASSAWSWSSSASCSCCY